MRTTVSICVLTAALGLGLASTSDAAYWNVFNFEGESATPANFATYATLADMLADTNRTGEFLLSGVQTHAIIGSGSDGTTYWNVFNFEGESATPANFATYATLAEMLADTNRTGEFLLSGVQTHAIIGSGSDGSRVIHPVPLPASLVLCLATGTLLGRVLLSRARRLRRTATSRRH
jgi:hypothetical protein